MQQILPARPRFLSVLLLLLLGLVVRPALATHLLGGELTYRYLDSDGPAIAPIRYEITVTVYNNCPNGGNTGIATPYLTGTIGLFDRANGLGLSLTQANVVSSPNGATVSGNQITINQSSITGCISPPVPTNCTVTGPSQPYQLQKFIVIVSLPSRQQGFYVVYSESARNGDIKNGGANNSIELYTALAPPNIPNRSPVFASTAVAIICAPDTTFYLNDAVDADGDRLAYSFGQPFNGGIPTTFSLPQPTITYTSGAGYSPSTPFGVGPGIFTSIDPNTGFTKIATPNLGKYILAVDVREYRTINGTEVLLGTVRRDIQLVVVNCPLTPAPKAPTSLTNSVPRNVTIEAGKTYTATPRSTQAGGNPLTMTLRSVLLDGTGGYDASFNGDPGSNVINGVGTATINSATGNIQGTFTFTPGCNAVRAAPYDVFVTVQDNGCAGKTIFDQFSITVIAPTGPTAVAGDVAPCANSTSTYTASGGTAQTITWAVTGGTIQGSNTANPVTVKWGNAGTGSISATGSTGGCPAATVTRAVNIQAIPALTVTGNRAICAGQSTSVTVSGGGTGAVYTVTGGPVAGSSPTFTLTPTATTTYSFASTATGGCPSTTTAAITVNPLPTANTGPAVSVLSNKDVTIGGAPVANYTYSWSPAKGLSSTTVSNPTVNLENYTGAPIKQTYTLTVTNTQTGCTATGMVEVTVNVDTELKIYNFLSNNAQFKNQRLNIYNVKSFPGAKIEIYNRWGRQVFATTNYDNDTNYWGDAPGSTDTSIAPGLYYYLFTQANGTQTKGWIEVVHQK